MFSPVLLIACDEVFPYINTDHLFFFFLVIFDNLYNHVSGGYTNRLFRNQEHARRDFIQEIHSSFDCSVNIAQ